ncbi:MAG: hypothetical protein ABI200_04685, partial [Gaiellales bacterium]
HDADPWWGDAPVAPGAPASITGTGTAVKPRPRRAAKRRVRKGVGWVVLGLLLAPPRWLGARMLASAYMRKLLLRGGILLLIGVFLACSVGVILINNVVIGRTAELGTLDDSRRELRRDNALLGAQAAKLSVPPVVVRRATRDLGMVRNPAMPKFVYFDNDHRRLTPGQRRRIIKRNRLRIERAAERELQSSGAQTAAQTSAKTTEQAAAKASPKTSPKASPKTVPEVKQAAQ